MDRTYLISVFIILAVWVASANGACPGRTEATMGVDAYLDPPTECIRVEVSPGCGPNSPHQLVIENTNCLKPIVYVGQGITKELNSRDTKTERYVNEGSSMTDGNIPQGIGVEWTREIYFKDNPNEKITIHGVNYPRDLYDELVELRHQFCVNEEDPKSMEYMYCLRRSLSEFNDGTFNTVKEGEGEFVLWLIGGSTLVLIIGALFVLRKK